MVALSFALCTPVWAQSPESRLLKSKLDSLTQRLSATHAKQQLMSRKADSIAQVISYLKTKPASPLETRSLNEAYRTSQVLADTLQILQSRALVTDRLMRQKAELLLENLNAEIPSLAEAKAAAKKKRDMVADQRLNLELQSCRQWQKY